MFRSRWLFKEMPTITKATPYWQALKVLALIFLLAEILLLLSAALRLILWLEFFQMSFFLLTALFLGPLLFRIGERSLFVFLGLTTFFVFLLLIFQTLGDRYFSQQVFNSYLKGEDYHAKANSLSIIASSNAMAHTQLVIDEFEFIRQCVQDVKQYEDVPSIDKKAHLASLKSKLEDRMDGLDNRFSETGYCNRSASANEKTVKSMYHKMLLYLDECLNTDRH